MKINLGTEAEFMERVKREFSPEVTEEECMEFLASCPFSFMPKEILIDAYMKARSYNISEYQSLLIVMESIWQISKDVNDEN